MIYRSCFLILIILCNSLWAKDTGDHIRYFHERLIMGQSVEVLDEPIIAEGIIPLFYESRNYQPAWNDREYALSVLELIRQSDYEGLYKEDYHYDALLEMATRLGTGESENAYLKAQFDFLLTDGLLVYALHLINGKVDAAGIVTTWNYDQLELLPADVIKGMNLHIENQSVANRLEQLKPQMPFYEMMKKGLAKYVQLADEGAFQAVPDAQTIRPGDDNEAVRLLKQRLVDMELLAKKNHSTLFDEELEAAVRFFQQQSGLDSDGIVGAESFFALNVPYSDRADQLRINIDRMRWVSNDLSSDFVMVNIAGYALRLVRAGEEVWYTDVMIGKVNTQTPIFKSKMSYLVFNPTWTVPRSIAARSLIPKMKANPNYAIDNDYQLINREGIAVDPISLDWSELGTNNFPYTIVQKPGEKNALGQVKFMFPNAHAIYLHDTPSRSLFSKSKRAFSSGCIRVKDPMEFARILLNDPDDWSDQDVDTVVQGRKLMNVRLEEPIDVLIMYWTVKISADGEINFVRDVYNRDGAVLAAFKHKLF